MSTLNNNKYYQLYKKYELTKVNGWIRENTNYLIPQLIIHKIIEILIKIYMDIFDSKFTADYVQLNTYNTIAKDIGDYSRPRSLLNGKYWTWMTSILYPGEHYKFFRINNIGTIINYGGLKIGVAQIYSDLKCTKYANGVGSINYEWKIHQQEIEYKEGVDSWQIEIKNNMIVGIHLNIQHGQLRFIYGNQYKQYKIDKTAKYKLAVSLQDSLIEIEII